MERCPWQVREQCGRGALAKSLNRVLVEHIRASLPNLRARLEEALDKTNVELKAYGDAPPGQTTAARCPARQIPSLTRRDCTWLALFVTCPRSLIQGLACL